MENLFFDLIRVSLGVQKELSRMPFEEEWNILYAIAKKQALLGIFYQGVIVVSKDSRFKASISKEQLLRWIGDQNRIKDQNRKINKQCLKLVDYFIEEGFKCSVLKGQGLAAIYKNKSVDLRLLRQPGDIDLWLGGGMEKVMSHINQLSKGCAYDYKNVHAPFFSDTEVEVHWRPEILMNLFYNRRLQKFWKDHEVELFSNHVLIPELSVELSVPSVAMSRFYILLHIYRHMCLGGVGLRQVMDYYFVLQQQCNCTEEMETMKLVKEHGMTRFTAALMWIMQDIFRLEERFLLCDPDEIEGKFLLNEIMQSGNFGHFDNRVKSVSDNKNLRYITKNLQKGIYSVLHYPNEVLWIPIWMAYHFIWKRTVGRYNY